MGHSCLTSLNWKIKGARWEIAGRSVSASTQMEHHLLEGNSHRWRSVHPPCIIWVKESITFLSYSACKLNRKSLCVCVANLTMGDSSDLCSLQMDQSSLLFLGILHLQSWPANLNTCTAKDLAIEETEIYSQQTYNSRKWTVVAFILLQRYFRAAEIGIY